MFAIWECSYSEVQENDLIVYPHATSVKVGNTLIPTSSYQQLSMAITSSGYPKSDDQDVMAKLDNVLARWAQLSNNGQHRLSTDANSFNLMKWMVNQHIKGTGIFGNCGAMKYEND